MEPTYEDASLNARRYASTLEHNIDFTDVLHLPNCRSSLLGNCKVLVHILASLHWYKIARMSKAILNSKIQTSLINVGNDDLSSTLDLGHSCT